MDRHASLMAQLRAYEAADALEDRHLRAFFELLGGAGDPFARTHFQPGHVTASLFIVDDQGRLLLHHHRRLGRWLQMGGHVEGGEGPHQTALREGSEESGLADLELVEGRILDLDVHLIPAGKGEPDHHHFDVRYLARTARPGSIMIDPAESNDLTWVAFDRAVELMNEAGSTRAINKMRRAVGAGV